MRKLENVECTRCGEQWYSEEFRKKAELPDKCVYCYRDSVRKIPDPPTRVDILRERIKQKRKEIPQKAAELKHEIVLWKENNHLLISMLLTGFLMIGLMSALAYYLFFYT